jgi:hypothetical protein
MVKNIRVTLDEDEYRDMDRVKGGKTWIDVLRRGIESLKAYPQDEGWKKQIMNKIGMEAKL